MPTLNECMELIRKLVNEKGFESDLSDEVLFGKALFAIMELSEALEAVKKHGVDGIKHSKHLRESMAEELIDSIFYILDLYGILHREGLFENPDSVFNKKLGKNFARNYAFGRPIEE